MELCLGTVQFGMDYGIRKQKRPLFLETIAILRWAFEAGIVAIDTANAYGVAEELLGVWLKDQTRHRVHLSSKIKPHFLENDSKLSAYELMKSNLLDSLSKLGTDYLDDYLLHTPEYVFDEEIVESLVRLKKEGYVRQIGVSIYQVDEANAALHHPSIDTIQLPFSVLDQRMKKENVLSQALELRDKTIYSRSAFLQGLVFMEDTEIPEFLAGAWPALDKLRAISVQTGYSLLALAIGYVKLQKKIDRLIVGVDSLTQLKEITSVFECDLPEDIALMIEKELVNVRPEIVIASRWALS